MTCEELIEALDEMPPEAQVAYEDYEEGTLVVKAVEQESNDLVKLR
jgi:hypothetical protein